MPTPEARIRPRRIAVTDLDRLKADPFAFYARTMLKLASLDPVDADPSPAWRGSAVHAILEAWMKQDECDPSRLRPRAEALLAETGSHPLLRALWQPRLLEAIDWIAAEVARKREEGRRPVRAEARGAATVAGVELYGIADRIDRCADGTLAIVDYKTGRAPSTRAVAEGFAMQLGLLGLIAERGGFDDITGIPSTFEYWSLARDRGGLGYVQSPTSGRNGIDPDEFTTLADRSFIAAAEKWLTGSAPFTAKLHPDYAPYSEYDQLMRLDEWYGREGTDRRDT
jgi:ATP-dependent helicase/nuclease subunit B